MRKLLSTISSRFYTLGARRVSTSTTSTYPRFVRTNHGSILKSRSSLSVHRDIYCRSMSYSGGGTKKRKTKKQAMQRQGNRNPSTNASSLTTAPARLNMASSSEFQTTDLVKSQLPSSSLPTYYHINHKDDEIHGGVSYTSEKKSSLTWKTNKRIPSLIKPSTNTGSGGLLLRNNSTVSSKKNNSNDDNVDDDSFLVDRDAMFDPAIHLSHAPQDWKGYEPATPLSDFLMQRIGVSGQPITTAEYMRHALTHPLHGYYTSSSSRRINDVDKNNDNDKNWDADAYNDEMKPLTPSSSSPHDYDSGRSTIFGRSGDFVTAPELSSVFGHLLCVWFMTIWQQSPLERPSDIQFVELGPGRGTLMADLLELAHSSKLIEFGQSIRTVHLVESSRELQQEQQQTLQKALGNLVRLEFIGFDDSDDDDDDDNDNNNNNYNKKNDIGKNAIQGKISQKKTECFVNTIRIEWHDDFSSFQSKRDKSIPTMVIMQEFIDALPVHQFQKTEHGWRERMIDVVSADATEGQHISTSQPSSVEDKNEHFKKHPIPRLRQVLAPQITPAVELLISSNYNQYDQFPEGAVVEICPEALILVQDVSRVLEESQGAALIIDYGENGTADTLRAFSRHQQVPLTSRPGQVDVTADVDFFALKKCLSTNAVQEGNRNTNIGTSSSMPSSIHAFGPVPQGEFLMRMGAGELIMNAIEKPETTDDQAQAFADALKYLVMPEHMGKKFKVLALGRKRDGLFAPAGIE
mmetsp:Transcript_4441/g.4987  ORF Transcript_4441/g.4987 Transcript_4441/m.4987 type:complete len:746 (+) Transcript_4441:58-2295(+)